MELLTPDLALIIWTGVSLIAVLFMLAAVIHLCLNKNVEGKDALRWLIAIAFIPVFGPLIYFKTSRKIKRLQ